MNGMEPRTVTPQDMMDRGIPPRFADATVGTLNPKCRKALGEHHVPRFGIFIHGEVGTGKTHTMAAMAHYKLSQKWVEFLYIRATELASLVKDPDLMSRCKKISHLFIDDLGVRTVYPEWIWEGIYDLIDHRYSHNMAISVSTNIPNLGDERINRRLKHLARVSL